jgi:heat shock protein HslJ
MKILTSKSRLSSLLAVIPVGLGVLAAAAVAQNDNAPANKLENTRWVLAIPVWEAKTEAGAVKIPTLSFTKDALSASSGCNGIGGGYTISDEGVFAANHLISTMMSCGPELDKLEQRYSQALSTAEHWELSRDGRLLLLKGPKETLVFERQRLRQ